ncbi:hypothetical protein [Spiroplasma endosymbiont of Amphimallon solstitiale]|uniref:hypothetical protein n=1 Tax=Spiroplasma endosymbiont of Amphimallon solstitiale TaxID=3066288 RepID=UPI00313BC28D
MNYSFTPNRETVLRDLGYVAERQYKNNFQKLETEKLMEHLLLQNTLKILILCCFLIDFFNYICI